MNAITIMKRSLIALSLVVMTIPVEALAALPKDMHAYRYDTNFRDDTDAGCGPAAALTTGSTAAPSDVQANNAKTVIGVAKSDNLGKPGALIALMVALAESSLTNLANTTIPLSMSNPAKEGAGSDHDSVGIFQQRPSTGWSTLATGQAALSNQAAIYQLMTPAYAAEAFLGSPAGSGAPGALSKGLQNVPNWQNLAPAVAAQHVQASADPSGSNYARQQAAAQSLVDKYFDTAPTVTLPVPLAPGSAASTSSGGGTSLFCTSDSTGLTSSTVAGCVNPLTDAGWRTARTDQGVDYQSDKPMPVRAICDGKILETAGAGWPGGIFIMIKMTSGPFIGKCTYVAEKLTNLTVSVGDQVRAGQQIATAQPGYPWTEWGWAAGQQTPSVRYGNSPDGTQMPGGKAFARFMRQLGAPTLQDPGPGPTYDGNSCP